MILNDLRERVGSVAVTQRKEEKREADLEMGEEGESREAGQGWPSVTKETSQELNKEMVK